MRIKKLHLVFSILLLTGSLFAVTSSKAGAATCKPVNPTGKTVGQIQSGSVVMPIKAFNYPAGGVMEPQKSTLMAAVSLRHMPLGSAMGTSVLVWHVNYNGCMNALNVVSYKGVGTTFKVTDEKGKTKTYVVTERYVVKKGDYQQSWFDLIGHHNDRWSLHHQ